MTDSAKLDLLLSEMQEMKQDIHLLKDDTRMLKSDMKELKEDIQMLKEDTQRLNEVTQGGNSGIRCKRAEVQIRMKLNIRIGNIFIPDPIFISPIPLPQYNK